MQPRRFGWMTMFGFLVACALGLPGCPGPDSTASGPAPIDHARNADEAFSGPLGRSVKKVVYLHQNWSPLDSTRFYFTSQGSQLVPYDWFLALERAEGQDLLRENRNLARYGYLVQNPGPMNPDGLPVGFARDDGRERAWLGFTCAACHTGQIEYQDIAYRIDGAPAQADVYGFLLDLSSALVATRDDDEKFSRFARRVLRNAANAIDRAALKNDLNLVIERRAAYIARNFPTDAPPGPARVDAFGAILNEVFHRAVSRDPLTPPTANSTPASAPVSYPFLWDTPHHDLVQWNGAAKNAGLGSLGRNVGEVLGVFGDFTFPDTPTIAGYASSVQVRNLLALEEWVKTLWSPQWPAAFPPIDPTLRERGRLIYGRLGCAECHPILNRTDPRRQVVAVMRAVGTDSTMADNFDSRVGAAGKLEGAFARVLPWPPLNPERIGPTAPGSQMLSHAVLGTIIGAWREAPEDDLSTVGYQRSGAERAVVPTPGGIYKGRPLNGVWATGPFLHNGSVASLYELLLPAPQRLASFTVGTRQFDPVKVGFRTDAPGFPLFHARDAAGTPVPGNSNEGHEYGANLPDEDRWALVEFLKSL